MYRKRLIRKSSVALNLTALTHVNVFMKTNATCFSVLVMIFVVTNAMAQGPRSGTPASLAIMHVNVIDTATGIATSDMTVVTKGDRIVSVVRGGTAPAGAQTIEGRGKFLIPGLWDMHVHLSYARSSALPVLAATGVTYVRDAGGDLSEIDDWRGRIGAGEILGPTILRAGPTLNGQESSPYHLVIANAADARMAARTLKKAGVDVFKTPRYSKNLSVTERWWIQRSSQPDTLRESSII
jgi:hypothetical protein